MSETENETVDLKFYLNEREMLALELKREGKCLEEIGKEVSVGPTIASHLIESAEWILENKARRETGPLLQAIRRSDETTGIKDRAINGLLNSKLDHNDPKAIAEAGSWEILKYRGVGKRSLKIIADALEQFGAIENANVWIHSDICPLCKNPFKRKRRKMGGS